MADGSSFAGGVFDSVAEAVGRTPLVRLNRVVGDVRATVFVKLEYLNPVGSVKDRAAVGMLLGAEEAGELRAGGTVVEASSGNTGLGLAALAAARGYRSVVVVPDRVSAEKIALLRAYGAEVHLTPGLRPVGHPEHLRSVALRLTEEIPGAWFAGQYDNPANPAAHRGTTGPEIWAQTGGRVTHFVAGIGTGGTVTGAGEYLKEASGGAVRVIGADPETSVYGGGDGRIWYVEAVGHFRHPETEPDLWPDSYHPEVVDRVESIPDVEAIRVLHRLAREEGLLLGGSSGTAIAAALRVARGLGPEAVVVVVAPDSGRAYLSKYYNDEWLGALGFPLTAPAGGVTVGEALGDPSRLPPPVLVPSGATVGAAKGLLGSRSALPVLLQRRVIGPAVVAEVLGSVEASRLADAPEADELDDHLSGPLPVVGTTEPLSQAIERTTGHVGPVLLADAGRVVALVDAERIAAAHSA
ncbi:PLP-dependent cysteine synthase family protein [Nocardia huaxiensis]|uniref:PLP-dependent cysteine synthase family protein n=1 Tax=Nocardia huaxiensis TaxID=2755382 RepID=UPI001E2BBAD0|nr:pyridoxal-phosphate dependent enzyme [Nocardia huaxiensis]UFS94932.1 pyridoxal-phosphate dependent enzyme [Nocardia huaxiensis]